MQGCAYEDYSLGISEILLTSSSLFLSPSSNGFPSVSENGALRLPHHWFSLRTRQLIEDKRVVVCETAIPWESVGGFDASLAMCRASTTLGSATIPLLCMRFPESTWNSIFKRRKAVSVELLSGGMARKSMTWDLSLRAETRWNK